MKKTIKILLVVIAIAALALGGAYFAVTRLGVIRENKVLYLREATLYSDVRQELDTTLKHKWLFDMTAKMRGVPEKIEAGRYEFNKGMSTRQVLTILRNGIQTPAKLTLNNVRTLPQLAGRLAKQLNTDSITWLSYLTDPATADRYNLRPEEVIGLFIPNTYEVYWTTSPEDLVQRMADEWKRFWNDERMSKLQKTGLSRIEAMTLASIVYEETRLKDEYPVIAGVYINRLNSGMKLQACPTAKYAVGDFTLRRILNRHINFPSPYNTYLNEGLPPGPICMPSIEVIDAVLDYKHHNYLFFAASPDYSGRNVFAATYDEHLRNSDTYHGFLDSEGIK